MNERPRIRRSSPRVTLRVALNDTQLLGSVLAGDSWLPWRVLLVAAMGEALTADERVVFQQLTGREREPGKCVEEFVGVIGRRGGKSRAVSCLAAYLGGLCEHPALSPGERGIVLIIAPDTTQADICLDYIEACFRNSPILSQLIEGRTARSLRLTNRIDVEVRAANFRTLRGPTYVAVIADECAFWLSENSSNPDTEILNAVRPGLATTCGSLFLISSPYARRGELWNTYRRHFGPDGDPRILVAQGTSRQLNSTLPQSVVDRAYERDAQSAAAEFGAEFRTDIENWASLEAISACVSANVFERPPQRGVSYVGFVDPSGGSSDSFTLAIGHNDIGREVRPPFSPEAVTSEFATLLKSYNIQVIQSDRWGGGWVTEQFSKFGIICEQSAKSKSDLYRDLLPLINSTRIELLDHPRLVSQLTSLERRTARGGKDSIDHPPGSHDDIANAVAGVAAINNEDGSYDRQYLGWCGPDATDPGTFRVARLMAHIARYGGAAHDPPPLAYRSTNEVDPRSCGDVATGGP